MSSFKPMVKMFTDEPKAILKLKKGGGVHHKHHKEHEEHGHKAMHHAHGGMHVEFESESGKAPKKPSIMSRVKAMNPNQYKKGGKVAHKLDGGTMGGMGAAAPVAPMQAMNPATLAQMDAAARNARAMQVRRALAGMKKGGSADHKMIMKLEKELHHHESMPMSKAHHKAHGGKVHHMSGHPDGSMEHHKAMAKHYEKVCKEGGSAHAHKMLKHHKAMCMGGKYASGGAIDKFETKTTIEGNAKKFAKTKMHDGDKHDKHHGTGEIHEDKPAGYKHGGHAHKHHKATGGAIPADTDEKMNKGKFVRDAIEGNEHDFVNTEMHTAKKDKAHGTKGIGETNAGGYKHGGHAHHKHHHKMHHKATGGAIPAATLKHKKEDHLKHGTYEGGDWEHRAADTATAGVKNRKTGEVKESNAGGFKHGGHASKKAYATGGNVVDDGKAVKMPKHFVSRPVANSLQSGTFKRGGKVK